MTAEHLIKAKERMTMVSMLVWTYRDQKADVMTGKGLFGPEVAAVAGDEDSWEPHAWSRCGCAQMEAIGHVGCRIDGGGWQRPSLHPDAEVIHDAVVVLSQANWMGAALLRRYGRLGGTPDWCGDIRQEFEPVFEANSRRPVQDRFDEVSMVKGRASKHLYCPVQLYPPNEWIDLARGEYCAWHGALGRLFVSLSDATLSRHELTGLGAVPEPWSDTVAHSP